MTWKTLIPLYLSATHSLRERERGASMAEYGLLLALIAVAALIALTTLGTRIAAIFDQVSGSL